MPSVKRVLLIEPFVSRPPAYSAAKVRVSPFLPLGLAYLAAILRRDGYEVAILDALMEGFEDGEHTLPDGMLRYGITDDQLRERIRAFAPDVVGVGAIFSAKDYDAKAVCRVVKSVFPAVPTVLGGAYAGAAYREIMTAEPAVDFIIAGEAEESLPALLRSIADGSDPGTIGGLCWRAPDGIRHAPKQCFIEDLDVLPLPARDLVDMKKYFRLGYAHDRYRQKPFAQMITSRGCPFKCTFCAIGKHWGAEQRFRSPENVLAEIDVLVKEHGVREIHFEDDNLTADKERAMAIFRGMRDRNYGITWTTPTGMAVSKLDDDLLDVMRDSGCYSITLAIESGNQEVLAKLMRKPVVLKHVPKLVEGIRRRGMLAKGFFMIGYPGETKATVLETIAFAKNLRLDWAFFFVTTPLPYTEMYDMALKKGYLQLGDFNPLTSLRESVIRSPEFTSEWLSGVREDAIVDINFRNNPNLDDNLPQAISDFEYVLSLYPHFDFAHQALGEAWLRKGDRAQAVACWRRALERNPANTEAQARLRESGEVVAPAAT